MLPGNCEHDKALLPCQGNRPCGTDCPDHLPCSRAFLDRLAVTLAGRNLIRAGLTGNDLQRVATEAQAIPSRPISRFILTGGFAW